jgi:hypothetical protein
MTKDQKSIKISDLKVYILLFRINVNNINFKI